MIMLIRKSITRMLWSPITKNSNTLKNNWRLSNKTALIESSKLISYLKITKNKSTNVFLSSAII